MIDIPVRVKDALKSGTYRKNYRVIVLDEDGNEIETLDNNRLVSESVKLDERMCSGKDLRFGLCEGSSLEFQYFNYENINGKRVKLMLDIEYLDEEGQLDWYEMPMGYFEVDSCPMQFSTGIRKATCYNKLKSDYLDVKIDKDYVDSLPRDDIFNNRITYRGLTIYSLRDYSVLPKGVKISYSRNINAITQNFNFKNVYYYGRALQDVQLTMEYREWYYTVPLNKRVYFNLINSLVNYYNEFYQGIESALRNIPVYDGGVHENELFYPQGTTQANIEKYIEDNIYKNNFLATQLTITTPSKPSKIYSVDCANVTKDGRLEDLLTILPYRNNEQVSITIRMPLRVYYKWETAYTIITQNLYVINTNYSLDMTQMDINSFDDLPISTFDKDVTLRELQTAIFEINCQFGRLDRDTDLFAGLSLNNSRLVPSESLFPQRTLYPMSNAERSDASSYEKLWTDSAGVQKFRYLIITYKGIIDGQEKDCELQRTVNTHGTQDYNMSSNWLFRNLVWTEQQVGEYADAMVELMRNVSWFPFEMWSAGLPYLETGDELEITNSEGTYTSYILQRQLNGIQMLKDTYINGELDIF